MRLQRVRCEWVIFTLHCARPPLGSLPTQSHLILMIILWADIIIFFFHKWRDSLRVDKLAQAHTASTWGISYLNRVLPGSKACDLSVDTFQGPRPVVMCLVRSYFHLLIQAVSHSFKKYLFGIFSILVTEERTINIVDWTLVSILGKLGV